MSRIGNKTIDIPAGVTAVADGRTVTVKGKQGDLTLTIPQSIDVVMSDGKICVKSTSETRQSRSFHGLTRSLIANMIEGVANGYLRELEIQGVGFKAALKGGSLMLSLGFASPVEYRIPEGVKITEEGGVKLLIKGPDKQLIGDVAARIRSYFPAEPYKGKGIRYKGERVRRKVGKKVA